jgi:hypothetical protein
MVVFPDPERPVIQITWACCPRCISFSLREFCKVAEELKSMSCGNIYTYRAKLTLISFGLVVNPKEGEKANENQNFRGRQNLVHPPVCRIK